MCTEPQSLCTIYIFILIDFEKVNFPNNDLSKWICGNTGENNYRFYSVCFVQWRLQITQSIPSHVNCFHRESLSDRWVLDSTTMNTICLKCFKTDLVINYSFWILIKSQLVSMLLSAFRGKETSKMVSSTFSLESEMLDNFQVKFFQHDWPSNFCRVVQVTFQKRFPVRKIWK